jgi:hypothetical protein
LRALLVASLPAAVVVSTFTLLPSGGSHQASLAAPAAVSAAQVKAVDPATSAVTVLARALAGQAAATAVTRHATKPSTATAPRRTTHSTATHSSSSHHASTHHASASGPTSWSALNSAIARIPSYISGVATWKVYNTGWWGTSDWFNNVIYISPTTPTSVLYSVAAHEWSHILSIRDYSGNVSAAKSAMASYFGGGTTMGPEYAADCMASLQGATYLHYTNCSNSKWRAGARVLLGGSRL